MKKPQSASVARSVPVPGDLVLLVLAHGYRARALLFQGSCLINTFPTPYLQSGCITALCSASSAPAHPHSLFPKRSPLHQSDLSLQKLSNRNSTTTVAPLESQLCPHPQHRPSPQPTPARDWDGAALGPDASAIACVDPPKR